MTKAQTIVTIQNVAESHLAQIVPALFVVTPLGQLISLVVAGDVSVKIGCIVGEQPAAHQLFFFPQTKQTNLRVVQWIFAGQRIQVFGQNLLKGVPEGLRGETLRRDGPGGMENGAAIPVRDLGLGTWLANAVDGRQQQIMRWRGTGARSGPERLKQVPEASLPSGKPEGTGQSEVAR